MVCRTLSPCWVKLIFLQHPHTANNIYFFNHHNAYKKKFNFNSDSLLFFVAIN